MQLILITFLCLLATKTLKAETDVEEYEVLNRRLLGLLGGGSGTEGGDKGSLLGGLLGDGGLLGGGKGLLGGLLGDGGLLGGLLGGGAGGLLDPVSKLVNDLLGPIADQLLGPGGILAGLGLEKGLVGNLVNTLSKTLGVDLSEIIEIIGKLLCLIKKLGLGVVVQLVKTLKLDVALSLNNFLCSANGSRLFDASVNATATIAGSDCLLNTVQNLVSLDVFLPSLASITGSGLNEKCKSPAGSSLIKGVFQLFGKTLNPELTKKILVLLNAIDLSDLSVSVPKILKSLECLTKVFNTDVKLNFLVDVLGAVGLKAVIGLETHFCDATDASVKASALLKLNATVGVDLVGKLAKQLGFGTVVEIAGKVFKELGEISLEVLRVVLCMVSSLGIEAFLDLFRNLNVGAILGLSGIVCNKQGEPVLLSAGATILVDFMKMCKGQVTAQCSSQIEMALSVNPCEDVCKTCKQLSGFSGYLLAANFCLAKCSTCPRFLG
ncbi:uncharacterized protein LOC131941047 isoform X2 [Physella acuta]|uniref:uncharacterized protein LOC131941047 isoform X2 n=1 Tax=Physella acuta TaxID=109671 RepID=UPI0027DE54C3|nr:uncharacterized protein LOC131941047 isoform X2 [Physella acuta]